MEERKNEREAVQCCTGFISTFPLEALGLSRLKIPCSIPQPGGGVLAIDLQYFCVTIIVLFDYSFPKGHFLLATFSTRFDYALIMCLLFKIGMLLSLFYTRTN